MRWYLFAQTILPPVLPMLAIYALWGVVEVAPGFVEFVFLLSLLPLLVQFGLWIFHPSAWTNPIIGRPWHPFGLILPLALLLIKPFLPVGEWAAKQVPCLCELVAGEKVPTDKESGFAFHVWGWGNARSFEFTGGMIIYTRLPRFGDLYFSLPEMRGHWTDSYTTYFPVTRSVMVEYVRRSDDFPEEQAEKFADRLWDLLNQYAQKRDLPPWTDDPFAGGEGPRIGCYVRPATTYLVSCLFSWLVSAFISGPLVCWYTRRSAR